MGKSSRDKGAKGERDVAKLFRCYGIEARRGCQFHGGPDSPDVAGVPGLHIEVKRVERLDLYGALEQCWRDTEMDDIPVVVHRRNGKPWIVAMDFNDFMRLYLPWMKANCHTEDKDND